MRGYSGAAMRAFRLHSCASRSVKARCAGRFPRLGGALALTARQRFAPMGGDGRRGGWRVAAAGHRARADGGRRVISGGPHRAGKVPAQRRRNSVLGHLRSPLEPGSSYSPRQRDRSSQPSLNRGRRSRRHAYRDFSFHCSPRADSPHPAHQDAGRQAYADAKRTQRLAERDQRLRAGQHPGNADGRYRAACTHAERWRLEMPPVRWTAS